MNLLHSDRFHCDSYQSNPRAVILSLLLLVTPVVTASQACADETNEPPVVTAQEVDALIARVNPEDRFPPLDTLKDMRGLALLVAAIEKDPNGPWSHFLNLAFIEHSRTARSLEPAKRKQAFAELLTHLKKARGVMDKDSEQQDELNRFQRLTLEENINVASIEAGLDFQHVKRSAKAMLAENTDENPLGYGNVIFKAHTMLGRVALREGRLDDAKHHLIESGKTPGSPNLNSYGPDFTLAGELVEAGERQVVVDFLDLVARFWATEDALDQQVPIYRELKTRNRELLDKWKLEILSGKVPRNSPDRGQQGWPG